MILRPYVVELFRQNKKLRYGLVAVLTFVLFAVIAYDRLSMGERIEAEQTFDCPALDQGCQIEVRNLPYTVKTSTQIATGIPFVLYLAGGGVEMHATWKVNGIDVEPNYYHMKSDGPDRWKANMILPSSSQVTRDWILHLEINARAVDIKTIAH